MELDRRLRTQWTESAQDWIETDQAIRTGMLDTWVLRALGDVSGKTVIDIGCGEGRFCRLLAKLGATVTGIDITEALIERARDLGGAGRDVHGWRCRRPRGGGGRQLRFDLAVSYIVLVDLLDYRRSIGEAYRVLKPGGRFVVCNVHPMRSADADGWVRKGARRLFYPLSRYSDEGPREFGWWGRRFVNMHRTLASYVSAFLQEGFVLRGLDEPTPSADQLAERPDFEDEFDAPNFITFTLEKPGG